MTNALIRGGLNINYTNHRGETLLFMSEQNIYNAISDFTDTRDIQDIPTLLGVLKSSKLLIDAGIDIGEKYMEMRKELTDILKKFKVREIMGELGI